MPLLDHFRPPISEARPWESFHTAWAAGIMRILNRRVLPPGYFAGAQVQVGRVEADVPTFERHEAPVGPPSGNGGVAVETWAPPTATLTMPAIYPDEIEVQVFSTSAGLTLVGAIELVIPRNKDRPEARRAFAIKCASYLQQGVGLMVVDVVTDRLANLHDELVHLLQRPTEFGFPGASSLYAVAYRPARRDPGGDQIDIWPAPLAVGQSLPTLALALRDGPVVPVDLEATYTQARLRSRL